MRLLVRDTDDLVLARAGVSDETLVVVGSTAAGDDAAGERVVEIRIEEVADAVEEEEDTAAAALVTATEEQPSSRVAMLKGVQVRRPSAGVASPFKGVKSDAEDLDVC